MKEYVWKSKLPGQKKWESSLYRMEKQEAENMVETSLKTYPGSKAKIVRLTDKQINKKRW